MKKFYILFFCYLICGLNAFATNKIVDSGKVVNKKVVEKGAESQSKSNKALEKKAKLQFIKESNTAWSYNESEDMDGVKSYQASLDSKNKIEFKFPYNDGSRLSITLFANEKGKVTSSWLFISSGQFNYFNESYIRIKFDDKKSDLYAIKKDLDSRSGKMDSLIITDKRFLKNLLKAKKVVIQAVYYNEGAQEFTFEVPEIQSFFKN